MVLQIRQESTPAIKQKKPLICLRFDLLSFIDYDPEYNKLMLKLDVNINLWISRVVIEIRGKGK